MPRRWKNTPRPIPELVFFRPRNAFVPQIWAGRPGSYQIYYPLPPKYTILKNQDPYRVVDNAMVYRKFCSGIFTIGGMTSWEGGQVEIFFKSVIFRWGRILYIFSKKDITFLENI